MTGRLASRARAAALALLACAVAAGLSACGNTLQDQPTHDRDFLPASTVHGFPVYWLGRSFESLPMTDASFDPGGALTLEYGDCMLGGQGTCVTPLSVITAPDNSFVPGTGTDTQDVTVIRGRRARVGLRGRQIAIATGTVVITVTAQTAAIARAAADVMGPINQPGVPGAPLPAPTGDTGFDRTPYGGPLHHYEPTGPSGPPITH